MLVPIPWQPDLYLTPSTLAYLQRASDLYGARLRVVSPDGAWRSYERQKYLYDLWLKGLGNTASDPDTGQRNHMRGAAFDLVLTNSVAQNACRAAGLIRDAAEPWHWNDPNWRNMPIISTLAQASLDSAPLVEKKRKPTMTTGYVNSATFSNGSATKDTVYARAGDSPGTPANWIEYTRGAKFGTPDDPAVLANAAHGPHQPLTADEWAKLKGDYLAPVNVGGLGTVTAQFDEAVFTKLAADIVAGIPRKFEAT